MKSIIVTLGLSASIAAQAMVLTSIDALVAAGDRPPFQFPPWSEGCIGLDAAGNSLGESNRAVAVWKVGPNAVVWSRHVSPQPTSKVVDVRHGTTHSIANVIPLGSDVVLGLVTDPFISWGAVWDHYSVSTNQVTRWWTNPATGLGFPFPFESIDAVSISNLPCAIVSGGPGAVLRTADACVTGNIDTFRKRWAVATNVQLTLPQPELWLQRIARNENPEFLLAGPQAQVPLSTDDAPRNPGFVMGDSGGGVFVRTPDGHWRLLGMLVSGAQCRGASAVASIISQSAFLTKAYWAAVGKPDAAQRYQELRGYFAAVPSWADEVPIATPPSTPPQQPPQSAPPTTVLTLTNWVTINVTNTVTNYVSRLKPSQVDAIEQFNEWAAKAAEAARSLEGLLKSNR